MGSHFPVFLLSSGGGDFSDEKKFAWLRVTGIRSEVGAKVFFFPFPAKGEKSKGHFPLLCLLFFASKKEFIIFGKAKTLLNFPFSHNEKHFTKRNPYPVI